MSKFKQIQASNHMVGKPRTPERKNWFQRHESIITFFTSITALLVSIFVMLDQNRSSTENLELVQQQINLAKAQFDTSLADRRDQSNKQKIEDLEFQKRTAHQDSITAYQLKLATEQLNNQKYLNNTMVENEQPLISLDSIQILKDNTFFVSVSNKGKRTFELYFMTLTILNQKNRYISCDTNSYTYEMYPSENQNFSFEREFPDSILKENKTAAVLKILYTDVILRRNRTFQEVVWWSKFEKDKPLLLMRSKDKDDFTRFAKFLKNRNWKYLED